MTERRLSSVSTESDQCSTCTLQGGEDECRTIDAFRAVGVPEVYVNIATGILSAGDVPTPRAALPIEFPQPTTTTERDTLFTRTLKFLRDIPLLQEVIVTAGSSSPKKTYRTDEAVLQNFCKQVFDNAEAVRIPVPGEGSLTRRLRLGSKEQAKRAKILMDMLTAWVLGRKETSGIVRQLELLPPELVAQVYDKARYNALNDRSYSTSAVAKQRLAALSGVHPDETTGLIPVEKVIQLIHPEEGISSIPFLDDSVDDHEHLWQEYANCMGLDPDLMFPHRGESTIEAKEVCKGCVVREDCLEYALANGEKFGIWGGLGERARRRIRKQRSVTATPKANVFPTQAESTVAD